jgi:hypothetical protein
MNFVKIRDYIQVPVVDNSSTCSSQEDISQTISPHLFSVNSTEGGSTDLKSTEVMTEALVVGGAGMTKTAADLTETLGTTETSEVIEAVDCTEVGEVIETAGSMEKKTRGPETTIEYLSQHEGLSIEQWSTEVMTEVGGVGMRKTGPVAGMTATNVREAGTSTEVVDIIEEAECVEKKTEALVVGGAGMTKTAADITETLETTETSEVIEAVAYTEVGKVIETAESMEKKTEGPEKTRGPGTTIEYLSQDQGLSIEQRSTEVMTEVGGGGYEEDGACSGNDSDER